MFKIECLCKDKDLGLVKRALAAAGAYDVKDVPLANAEVKGGKVRAKSKGGVMESVWTQIKGLSVITPVIIKQALAKEGLNSAALNYAMKALAANGRIKKTAKRGEWKVMKK